MLPRVKECYSTASGEHSLPRLYSPALFALVAAACAAPPAGGGAKLESSTEPTTTFSGPNGPYTAPYGTTFPDTTPSVPTGDGDADGVDAPLDCDDRDPSSAPGLPELACDGRDNLDGDGYGDVAILDVTANVVRVWFGRVW